MLTSCCLLGLNWKWKGIFVRAARCSFFVEHFWQWNYWFRNKIWEWGLKQFCCWYIPQVACISIGVLLMKDVCLQWFELIHFLPCVGIFHFLSSFHTRYSKFNSLVSEWGMCCWLLICARVCVCACSNDSWMEIVV